MMIEDYFLGKLKLEDVRDCGIGIVGWENASTAFRARHIADNDLVPRSPPKSRYWELVQLTFTGLSLVCILAAIAFSLLRFSAMWSGLALGVIAIFIVAEGLIGNLNASVRWDLTKGRLSNDVMKYVWIELLFGNETAEKCVHLVSDRQSADTGICSRWQRVKITSPRNNSEVNSMLVECIARFPFGQRYAVVAYSHVNKRYYPQQLPILTRPKWRTKSKWSVEVPALKNTGTCEVLDIMVLLADETALNMLTTSDEDCSTGFDKLPKDVKIKHQITVKRRLIGDD